MTHIICLLEWQFRSIFLKIVLTEIRREMDILGKTVLVLGGYGLVGSAFCRRLIAEKPRRIIISSLRLSEAEEEIRLLRNEFRNIPEDYFIAWGGNIFVRDSFKNSDRQELLEDPTKREMLMQDTMEELSDGILKASSLYRLITDTRPEIIIDCINTATGIAYQDCYSAYRQLRASDPDNMTALKENAEKMVCSMYIPQLIRHIQILYASMKQAGTRLYFKIGTSGTGGMGLNIPYTHSEERPSRVLLSKSSVAGAHSLLLFLMGRTPDTAITKEIKPAAAIAWKQICYGIIKKKGKPIELIKSGIKENLAVNGRLKLKDDRIYQKNGEYLKSVFIDTGENGIFAKGEFETITAQHQMEFVTPEEIAEDAIFEIKGGNSGHDIISALDIAAYAPTYRAGYIQHLAVEQMQKLENEYGVSSVAFELLGPPRLSKLLYEIHILSLVKNSMKELSAMDPGLMSEASEEILEKNGHLLSEILSIGIPVLLNDQNLLRGPEIKIPAFNGLNELPITAKSINLWAHEGWVDLRPGNMSLWKSRLQEIMKEAESIGMIDSSSRHVRTRQYWNGFEKIDAGRIVSWIFIHEEKGLRMKS